MIFFNTAEIPFLRTVASKSTIHNKHDKTCLLSTAPFIFCRVVSITNKRRTRLRCFGCAKSHLLF